MGSSSSLPCPLMENSPPRFSDTVTPSEQSKILLLRAESDPPVGPILPRNGSSPLAGSPGGDGDSAAPSTVVVVVVEDVDLEPRSARMTSLAPPSSDLIVASWSSAIASAPSSEYPFTLKTLGILSRPVGSGLRSHATKRSAAFLARASAPFFRFPEDIKIEK